MATQTVTFGYTTGQTLTLKLGALATDTIVDTASATERSNQTGIYAAAFTDVAAGVYRAIAYSGSTPVLEGFVELAATTAVFAVEAVNPTDRTTILDRIGAFTGTGVNTILGFLLAIMKSDASTPSDVGGTFAPADDSLEAQANASGTGERTITVHVTNSSGGADIEAASVTIKDANDFVKGNATTNSSGNGNVYVDDGPYTVIASKEGFITNSSSVTVTADDTVEITLTLNSVSSSPDDTTVAAQTWTYSKAESLQAGVEVYLQLVSYASGSTGRAGSGSVRTYTSDANGLVDLGSVVPGATYRIWRNSLEVPHKEKLTVIVPSNAADPYTFPSLVGEE